MSRADDGPITVLHVDDDASFAELVRDSLEREDDRFDVRTVNAPDEGLESVSGDVDCIVCDYKMPGTDGLELLEAVREDHPDLPFILFTGEGSETVAAEAIERDVTSYLQKERGTAQFAVLANRIKNHVEQYRSAMRADRLERKYRLVAEVATDVFWTVDLETEAIELSEGVERFGYDPSELDPTHEWWFGRIHPEDRERMAEEHETSVTPTPDGFEEFTGDRGWFANEFRWQRADGTYADVMARGVTIFEDGDAVRQIGTMTDISERKERNRELELFESLVDRSNDAFYVADAETGALEYVNRTACEQLGYGRDALLDRTVPDISRHFSDAEAWVEHIPPLRERGHLREEDVHVGAEGSEHPVEVSITYVELDGEGHVVTVARDITDRQEREETLRRQNERLERFVSVVSHDLRNPLNVAKGYLELVDAEGEDAEHLETVANAHDRMERIIGDLLYLASEAAEIGDIEPVDLDALVETAWETVHVESNGVQFTVDGNLPTVNADPDRLQQLVENLFANAVDHGGPDVSVEVVPMADGFAVCDDGPGIPADECDAIFDEGFTTAEDGTGIGLSIVADIARAHGWSVDVCESDAGGARFEVTGVDTAQ